MEEKLVERVQLVKPLEWREARVSDRWERYSADTLFGSYEALEWSNGTFGGSVPVGGDEPNEEFVAASIEEAKDIAQNHYEAKIGPALNDKITTLLSAAEAFITEAENMGWGERSETALPGAWDNLKLAVERAKG